MHGYHRIVTDDNSPSVSADGNEPAPGSLRLVQSFANTLNGDTDLLRSREEAAAWLHATDLLPGESGLTNSEHAALLRLRESLRDMLTAHAGGREDADAAARLTKALADGRLVLTVDSASTLRLASAARASYPNVVAAIGIAIADATAAGTWPRLKICAAQHCDRAFYDVSGSARCATHLTGGVVSK